jgi:hypothetical protein
MRCTHINNYITTYNNIVKKCLPVGRAFDLTMTTSSFFWPKSQGHKGSGIGSLAGGAQ